MKYLRTCSVAAVCLLNLACQPASSPFPTVRESKVHIRPVWSTDGRTIAFKATMNQVTGLYLVDTSGANIRLLRHAEALVGYTWSPDSRWMVYSDSSNLYRISVNGDSVTQLTSVSSDVEPGWSYDGTKIMFLRETNNYPVVSMLDLATDSVTGVLAGVYYPTWHPNGQFVGIQYGDNGGGLYTNYFLDIQPDSGFATYVWSFTDYGQCGFISVNPTGAGIQQIAFAYLPDYGYRQIYVVNLANGSSNQLTDDGGDYPSFSPDGTKIVYMRSLLGDGGLWIINSDGTGKHRLTTP